MLKLIFRMIIISQNTVLNTVNSSLLTVATRTIGRNGPQLLDPTLLTTSKCIFFRSVINHEHSDIVSFFFEWWHFRLLYFILSVPFIDPDLNYLTTMPLLSLGKGVNICLNRYVFFSSSEFSSQNSKITIIFFNIC